MATLVIEHSDIARSARLGMMLRDAGHRLDVRRPVSGDALPTSLDGIDAVVVLGGDPDPMDDGPSWMTPELELLRAAHDGGVPLFGICLGSQLIARALGGEVKKMDGDIELGYCEIRLTPAGRDDPLFAGQPWSQKQIQWHRYHASTLPAGARVLAGNERTPHQAWAVGMRTYAVQYHPEFTKDIVHACMDDGPGDLSEARLSREAMEKQIDDCHVDYARRSSLFFERMVQLLMAVDRRY